MDNNYDDTFLARWINNELSPKELDEFKNSPDFSMYQKIAKKSSEFRSIDFNKKKVYKSIQENIESKKETKVKPLFSNWMYAAAASVVVLFGLFFFLNQPTEISTEFGEQIAVKLPDNSEVILNAKSTISFNEKEWKYDRSVVLNGEAYFKVAKGKTFTVKTSTGSVTVLGTQFTVNSNNDLFEVQCFEGKVQAKSNEYQSILTQGKAFRKTQDSLPEEWLFTEQEPSWKNGESSFKSAQLKYVIKALEKQYNIKIKASKINLKQRFTGSFTHKNLQIALQTVFVPMKIDATFTDEKTVSLVKQ